MNHRRWGQRNPSGVGAWCGFLENQQGFGLIEVTVAILILGIVTVPLVRIFLMGNLFTARARHDVAAVNQAQEIMEGIKAIPDNQMGTARGASDSTITLEDRAAGTDDFYQGYLVATTGGPGAGQVRRITDYAGTSRLATVDPPWGTIPESGTGYLIFKSDVNCDFRVAVTPNPDNPNLKTVTVSVYYPDGSRVREIPLSTEKLKR